MKRTEKGYEAYVKVGSEIEATNIIKHYRATKLIAQSMADRTGCRACVIGHSGIDCRQRVVRWFEPRESMIPMQLQ